MSDSQPSWLVTHLLQQPIVLHELQAVPSKSGTCPTQQQELEKSQKSFKKSSLTEIVFSFSYPFNQCVILQIWDPPRLKSNWNHI